MKKILSVLSVMLVVLLLVPTFALAAGSGNSDTIADWNITVPTPQRTVAIYKGSEDIYYIYPQSSNSIPYVMLKTYNSKYDTFDEFYDEFTDYMRGNYRDLQVVQEPQVKTIGNKECCVFQYAYKISGYDAVDTRVVILAPTKTYMFASKEIDELNMTVGSLLTDTVANCTIFDDDGNTLTWGKKEEQVDNTEEYEDSMVYLCTDDNGEPIYWLDMTGSVTEGLLLHFYVNDDQEVYDGYYILNLDSATYNEETEEVSVSTVYDENGNDVSKLFKTLTLTYKNGMITMDVMGNRRGSIDVPTGSYVFVPVGFNQYYEYYDRYGAVAYWFELSESDNAIVVHKPTALGEERLYFDMNTAEWVDDNSISVGYVCDKNGKDITSQLGDITIRNDNGNVVFIIKPLSKIAEALMGKGTYVFVPNIAFLPQHEAPYTAQELGNMARYYFLRHEGMFPSTVNVDKNRDGTYTILLFDGVNDGDVAWYTVDAYGDGYDEYSDATMSLTR